jgi:broad specificity phosphatase PhoE
LTRTKGRQCSQGRSLKFLPTFSRLTELGKQQVEDAYRAFDDDVLEELRQSDLQQLEQRLPPTDLILDNLREIEYFDWEGRQSGASSSISRILARTGSWES